MRKLIFLLWVMVVLNPLQAQVTQKPGSKGIPNFDIEQTSGSHLRAADLVKGQPVMFVYFDPDCDHCTMFIQELLKQINAFKNVQIVMVTYIPVRSLKKFVNDSGIGKYPVIKVGTEGSNFIVRYHYNVVQFPFLALHGKNGSLFATYESEVPSPGELAVMFRDK